MSSDLTAHSKPQELLGQTASNTNQPVDASKKAPVCQDMKVAEMAGETRGKNVAENSTLSNSGPGSPISVESDANNQAETGSNPATNQLQKLVVIYFNGVSCMGKSELLRRFSEWFGTKGITTRKVSLDKVAKGIMDRYKEENDYQGEEAFTLCIGPIFEAFHAKIIEAAESMASECAHGVLMIDDCSLAPTVLHNLQIFCQKLGSSVMFYKFYPENVGGFRIAPEMEINLSFQFVLNMCYRVLHRGSHPTFNYCPEKKLQLVLSFIRVYSPTAGAESGLEAESDKKDEAAPKTSTKLLHEPIPIEFHQEKQLDLESSPEMQEVEAKLRECMSKIVPFESPVVTAVPECRQFVDLLRKTDSKILEQWVSFGRQEVWTEQFKKMVAFFL